MKRGLDIDKTEKWLFGELGKEISDDYCVSTYPDFIECRGMLKVMLYTKTLRIIVEYLVGYVDGDDNNDNISLSIGTYSPL